MDDLVPECKKKMARFRIQELKDVLGHLGLAKTGRKQELVDRILALISDEEASNIHSPQKNKLIPKEDVVKIIDDTYRKMPHTSANDQATAGHSASDGSSVTPKVEIVNQNVRCPCGGRQKTEFMIQCADPQCHVLQHIECVIIPVEPTEGSSPGPSQHYCELCRINRCDPFWKTLAHPLYPVKLRISSIIEDGSQILLNVEKSFQITKADVCLLESSGYDVQAWCILLNDSVPFRMQWPQYPDLKVNGIPVKTINRPGSKMLGANGRDDGPSISIYLCEGRNIISLSGSDARTFCLGLRLVKQRTVQEVINLIPGEEEGESFTEAVARVCRCIGGGASAANDDSDSDLEVIADNITINLRCPMSGCRMKTAARFKGCIHLGCFDLHTLVQINQRSRKWQCPICLKNYSLEDIIIDPYLNRIVKMMQPCDEDVTEIEVKSDGFWRTKIGRPFMDLERWHLPDGSLCSSQIVDLNILPAEKSEHQLDTCMSGHGISGVGLPRGNQSEECFTNYGREIISMSSGSSDDMREDQNIDHHGTSHFDTSTNQGNMMDYTPYNNNQTSGIPNRSSSSSLGGPNLIVLSDSDDENNDTVSATAGSRPDPPNGGFTSHAANPVAPDIPVGSVSGDVRPKYGQMSNNSNKLGGPFSFPRQPRTLRRPHARKDLERN